MLRNRLMLVFGLIMAVSMVLAACGPKPTATPVATEPPTAVPTEAPKRTGAWVDQVVMTVQNSAEAAVTQLQAGDIDVYAYSVSDVALFDIVKNDPNLAYTTAFGSYTELTMNPVLNFVDGRLNPMGDPQIREAVNWLMDREYIVQEIYGGLANVKVTSLNSAFPDYARYIDTLRGIENKYAYDFDKASQVITERMTALGATLVDGKWTFNDAPVTLIFIIRTEDERQQIGDYAASQFEKLGFTADRQYKTRTEASPIWNRSNPADGLWNIYTGGWITTAVSRDDATNFGYFYTALGSSSPLWQAYQATPEFQAVCDKLWVNDFASMDERAELFKEALVLAQENSNRVWLADQISFSPQIANLAVTYDLAGGVAAAQMWPFAIRFKDAEGGVVRWAQPGLLVEPWNVIAGSNWVYDSTPKIATADYAFISNPYTGLSMPQRAESASVVVKTGLPVGKTLDWVDLSFQDQIDVPADAWVDWDAANQVFITVGEKFPEGLTANVKYTVTYPADLFTTNTWHDGSPLSVGDFVMKMIMYFDPAKPESAIYDEAQVPNYEAFWSHFKGVKIISTDPLVIEGYDDFYSLDAENSFYSFWPAYDYGQASWHALAAGILAESNKELTFSTDKSSALGVEWMSYIAGPSLEILTKYVSQAAAESYIPFAATLGQYVTTEEAAARWANIQAWYTARHHYWVGLGPFYLESVFPVEVSLTLAKNPNYTGESDKWSGFSAPKIPVVDLTGPATVKIGTDATFDVLVSFENAPYPAAELSGVKFLFYDANGTLVTVSEATFVADGQYQIVVPTTGLAAGSNTIEVAVTSLLESIPALARIQFVTEP